MRAIRTSPLSVLTSCALFAFSVQNGLAVIEDVLWEAVPRHMR